jgi:ATP-dependent protease ClpP protease subunit
VKRDTECDNFMTVTDAKAYGIIDEVLDRSR